MTACYIGLKLHLREENKVDTQCESCKDDETNWRRRYNWDNNEK